MHRARLTRGMLSERINIGNRCEKNPSKFPRFGVSRISFRIMGAFVGWAAFAMKRKKNDSKIFEELETTTRFLDTSCQSVNIARKSQEAVTRMLKEQLTTLRKSMANHDSLIGTLKEHDKVVLKKYEEAKRELKRLDGKRSRVEQHYRTSRQRLNDLIVEMEDEKRKNHGRPPKDNSWLTQTL